MLLTIYRDLFEMAGSVKKFTMAEVKEHNTATDLWTVIHDRVYDVTKFQNEVSFLCVLLLLALRMNYDVIKNLISCYDYISSLFPSILVARKFSLKRLARTRLETLMMLITAHRPCR